MSRIGRKVITIPAGVTVSVEAENLVTVKGPKGTLTANIHNNMIVTVELCNTATDFNKIACLIGTV